MTDQHQPVLTTTIVSTVTAQGNTSLSCCLDSTGNPKNEIQRAPVSAANMADLKMMIEESEQAQGSIVEELYFKECDFTDQDAFQGLLEVIAAPSSIGSARRLILSGAKFSGKSDFSALLSTLGKAKNSTIRHVNLSNYLCSDYVSNDGSFQRLLECNTQLESLDLSGHSLPMQAVVDLTNGLRLNSTLRELKMHNCFLDETAADLILKSTLEHDKLQVLDLGANNHFSPVFLNTSVAPYMQKTKSLQSLTLDHSGSMFAVESPAEIQAFLRALRLNKTLCSLSLRYCRLKQVLGEAILSALTVNNTLKTLDLEFTGFGLRDKGNEILIKLLPKWKALQTLKMHTVFPASLAQPLLDAMRQNSSMQSFSPRISSAANIGTQNPSQQVQSILRRNRCLERAQTLLQPSSLEQEDTATPAMLPLAMANLSSDRSGAAASYQLLEHWIGYVATN